MKPATDAFTARERAYLRSGPTLARVATVGADGRPHVVPTGWSYDESTDTIVLRGHALERTKKYRDARATERIAVVIDHVEEPWRPIGIEIRGRAEVAAPPDAFIRVHPERVISCGIESDRIGDRTARDVTPRRARPPGTTVSCRRCGTTHPVAGLSLISMHRTSIGITAYLRCPAGHPIVHTIEFCGRSAA